MLFELFYDHFLYHFDALQTHRMGVKVLEEIGNSPEAQRIIERFFGYDDPSLETTFLGQKLKSRVGIAGGLVKTGKAVDGLAPFGPAWVEAGTYTFDPYSGNEDKFIKRYPGGAVNYMGFPNGGLTEGIRSLKARKSKDVKLAVNIGETPNTKNVRTAESDLASMAYTLAREFPNELLAIVYNPYCRNVKVHFRNLDNITHGLRAVNRGRLRAREEGYPNVNILLKLGPDFSHDDLKRILERTVFADGYIATNTTASREGLPKHLKNVPGGASGSQLEDLATLTIARIREFYPKVPLVGVGGIRSYAGARVKKEAGADVVQVLTGLVRNPGLPKEIKVGDAREMKRMAVRQRETDLVPIIGE